MQLIQFDLAKKQTGAVMVVSLLLLLVMTVLALGASQTTRMQERMAGNARDHDLALQSAEAGVRAAERWIKSLTVAPSACNQGKCDVFELGIVDKNQTQPIMYRTQEWWDATARTYTGAKAIAGSGKDLEIGMAKQEPQYLIEELEEVSDSLLEPTGASRMHYRITSRGVGGSDQSAVVIQSTWARRY